MSDVRDKVKKSVETALGEIEKDPDVGASFKEPEIQRVNLSIVAGIPGRQEEREYSLCYRGKDSYGTYARELQKKWRPVTSNDPEAMEYKAPDGTRVFGDTILMWRPKDVGDAIRQHLETTRARRIDPWANTIKAMDESLRMRGARGVRMMIEEPDDEQLRQQFRLFQMQMRRRQMANRQTRMERQSVYEEYVRRG